jgi:hypothetical protein
MRNANELKITLVQATRYDLGERSCKGNLA